MKRLIAVILAAACFITAPFAEDLMFSSRCSEYVCNDRLYILHKDAADDHPVLSIFDLKAMPEIKLIGSYTFPDDKANVSNLVVHNSWALFPAYENIRILDVGSPADIRDLGFFTCTKDRITRVASTGDGSRHALVSAGGKLFAYLSVIKHSEKSGDLRTYTGISELTFDGKRLKMKALVDYTKEYGQKKIFPRVFYADEERCTVLMDMGAQNQEFRSYTWKSGQVHENPPIHYDYAYPDAWAQNGRFLYLDLPDDILAIYDTTAPDRQKMMNNPFKWYGDEHISVIQDTLYLTSIRSLAAVDLHDPFNPRLVGTLEYFPAYTALYPYKNYGICFMEGGSIRLFALEPGKSPVSLFSPEALLEAVKNQDYLEMERQISHGVHPYDRIAVKSGDNVISEEVIVTAIRDDDPKLLSYLLAHCGGRYLLSDTETMFTIAARLGSVRCLPVLNTCTPSQINLSLSPTARPPIVIASARNDLPFVKKLLELGADVNAWTRDRVGPINALTVAPSPEMKAFLISEKIGAVKGYYPKPIAVALADGIRVRTSGDLKAAVIGRVAKDERVTVLCVNFERVEIDGVRAPWMSIEKADGTTGWCFGGFFYVDELTWN